MTEPVSTEPRCLLVLDIAGPGAPSDAQRTALRGIVSDAVRAEGTHVEERGDGMLIVLPAKVTAERAWDGLIRQGLARLMPRTPPVRLRVALHRARLDRDAHGFAGPGLNVAFRLVEARRLRRVLDDTDDALAVIVSDEVRRELPEAGTRFTLVEVQVKDQATRAWIATLPAGGPVPKPTPVPRSGPEPAAFVGRVAEVLRLDAALLPESGPREGIVTITGPPGVGKSALADHWAALRQAHFDVVLRFSSATGGLSEPLPPTPGGAALVVVDDVDEWSVAAEYVRRPGVSAVLITRSATGVPEPRIDLAPLPLDESIGLLRDAIGDARADREAPALGDLAERLGGLPLTLTLAGESLAAWPGDTVAAVLAELKEGEAAYGAELVRRVFAFSYGRLDDDLKRAFRLTSVFAGLDLTAGTAAALYDVDQSEAGRLLDDLARVNLMETADGERYHLHRTLLDISREYCERAGDDRDAAQARLATAIQRDHMPEGVILRDHWTLRDDLSYTVFIEAIASFLTSPETRPPLTIGIKGAWGSGKTSLMRMLRRRLDPGAPADTPTRRVTNREVLRGTEAAEPPDGLTTVWFNPWMYQRTEQVWAGLAHEIITQVTARLPTLERERFWLRLNRARVDHDAIRRRCYRLLFGRLLPRAVVWLAVVLAAALAGAVALGVLATSGALDALAARVLPWVPAAGVAGWAAVDLIRRVRAFWRGPAAGSLARLVRAPGPPPDAGGAADPVWSDPAYRSRTGYLRAVHDDVRHVIGLVASEERPLVVFVDDLDRCDSRTVAEVIEALNVFLAGEFPDCAFVIAMEPAAVAAHIEAAHPELVAAHREGRTPGDWSSPGWRFLDKIVQLPLTLPAPRTEHVQAYVEALLRHDADGSADGGPAPVRREASVNAAMSAIRERATAPDDLFEAAHAVQAGLTRTAPDRTGDVRGRGSRLLDGVDPALMWPSATAYLLRPGEYRANRERGRPKPDAPDEAAAAGRPLSPVVQEAAMRVFAEMYDDAAARRAVAEALPVLGSHNPREIKRFVNLFRFYSYIRLADHLAGRPVPDPPQLAKLTALVIRWPQLLAALGRTEGAAAHPVTELERAAGDDAAWAAAVRTHLAADGDASWAADLRAFLAREPAVGPAAGML